MARGGLEEVLETRIRSAVSVAERATRRSQVLIGTRQLVHTPEWMMTRCAWCGRVCLGGVWTDPDETPRFLPTDLDERTTHGICRSCVKDLEAQGLSRTRA
jgi:hypothetical protein